MTDSSNTSSPMCIDLPVVHETVVPWSNIREVGSKLRLKSDKVSHQVNTKLMLNLRQLDYVEVSDSHLTYYSYIIDIDCKDIDVIDNIEPVNCNLVSNISSCQPADIKKETIIPLVSIYWFDRIRLTATFSSRVEKFGFTARCTFLTNSARDCERARQYTSKYSDHQTWASFIPNYPRDNTHVLHSSDSWRAWFHNKSRPDVTYSTSIEQLFKCVSDKPSIKCKHTIQLPPGIIIDNIEPIRCNIRIHYGKTYMKDITVIPTIALKHTNVTLTMYGELDPTGNNQPCGFKARYTRLPGEYVKEIMSGKLIECGGYRYFDGIIEIDRTGNPYKVNQTNQAEKIECDKSIPCLICNNCDKPIRPKKNILSDIRSICNEDSLDSTKKISILQTMLTSEEETLPMDV